MKPRFIEVIRLGVLLAVIAVVVGTIQHSYDGCRQTVESVGYALQGDSVSGPLSWLWSWFTWFVYLGFVGCVAVVATIVLHALGVFASLLRALAGAFVWAVASVREAWNPPSVAVDTVVGKRGDGSAVTLAEYLRGVSEKIRVLEAKTAGLEMPPPPKTPEQELVELRAELAFLRSEAKRGSGKATQGVASE